MQLECSTICFFAKKRNMKRPEHITIQKAYTILEQQGYIYPVKGRGNFVSGNQTLKEKKEEVFFQKLRDVIQEGKELGIEKERCIAKTSEFYEEDKV